MCIRDSTLTVSILCCGLLFSCGSSKKTAQFEESFNDDESSEILVIDEKEVDKTINQDLTLVNTLRYENAIYNPSIHSVQLHPIRFEMGNPLIHLSFKDSLLLSFDDLSSNPQNYAYTLIHCNADWTPSELMELSLIHI